MAQHRRGGPAAQHVGVVDAVATGQQRVHQRQDLAAGPVVTWPVAQVDQLVDDRLHAKPLGQRGRQQQPGVGDRMIVIDGDHEPIEAVGGWHRESALLIGTDGRLSNAILPAQRPFS
jgi:hypothetical protein